MHKKLIITIGLIIALVGVGVVAQQQLRPAHQQETQLQGAEKTIGDLRDMRQKDREMDLCRGQAQASGKAKKDSFLREEMVELGLSKTEAERIIAQGNQIRERVTREDFQKCMTNPPSRY